MKHFVKQHQQKGVLKGVLYRHESMNNSYSPFTDENTIPPPHNPDYKPIDTHFVGAVVPHVEDIQNEALQHIDHIEKRKQISSQVRERFVHAILFRCRLESLKACCDKTVEKYHTNRVSNYNASKTLPLRYRNMGGKVEYELEDLYSGEVRGGLAMATRELEELQKCNITSKRSVLRFIFAEAKRTGKIEPQVNAIINAFISLDSMKGLSKVLKSPSWLYRQGHELRSESPFDIPNLHEIARALSDALNTVVRIRTNKGVKKLKLSRFTTLPDEKVAGFWSICNREGQNSTQRSKRYKSLLRNDPLGLLGGSFDGSKHSAESTRSALLRILKSAYDGNAGKYISDREIHLQKPLKHAMDSVHEAHIPDLITLLRIISYLPWSNERIVDYTKYCKRVFDKVRTIIESEGGKSVKYTSGNQSVSPNIPIVREYERKLVDDEGSGSNRALKRDPYCFFSKRLFYQGDYSVRYIQPHHVLQLTDVLLRIQTRLENTNYSSFVQKTLNESSLIHSIIIKHLPSKAQMSTQFSATSAVTDMCDLCNMLFNMVINRQRGRDILFSEEKRKEILLRFEYMMTASLSNTNRQTEVSVPFSPMEHMLNVYTKGISHILRKNVHCLSGCFYAFTCLGHIPDALSNIFSALMTIVPSLGTYSILLILRSLVNLQELGKLSDNQSTGDLLIAVISRRVVDQSKLLASKKPVGIRHRKSIFSSNESLCELAQLACLIGNNHLQEATLMLFRKSRAIRSISRLGNTIQQEERVDVDGWIRTVAIHYMMLRAAVPVRFSEEMHTKPTRFENEENHTLRVSAFCKTDEMVLTYLRAHISKMTKSKKSSFSWHLCTSLVPHYGLFLSRSLEELESTAQTSKNKNYLKEGKRIVELTVKPMHALLKWLSAAVSQQSVSDLEMSLEDLSKFIPYVLKSVHAPFCKRAEGAHFLKALHDTYPASLKLLEDFLYTITDRESNKTWMGEKNFSNIFILLQIAESIPPGMRTKALKNRAAYIIAEKLKNLEAVLENKAGLENSLAENEVLVLLSLASKIDCLKRVEKSMKKEKLC